MFSPAVFSAPIFLLRRRNNIHIQKADTMGKVTIGNRNTGKFDKNRKRKTQTGNTVLKRPLRTGNAGRRQNPDSTHSKAYDAGSLHPAVPGRRSGPHQEIWPLSVKENGDLLTPDTFKYCARVIHHELGNPLFHSHCLRHTHGTMLAEQGVNPKTIMERLGHKDIKTTLQVYTFNTEVMQQTAVDVLESAINR